jgi:uncharacterized protein (TIGR03032 family)
VTEPRPTFELTASRQLPSWLGEQRVSLAFTTYQAGKLFLIGLNPSSELSVFERTFARCMGMAVDPQRLWLSSLYQIWRLENALALGQLHQGYDRLYVPQVGYTTGDVDVHDLAVDASGRPVFVNTLFGCLATISESHSFVPLWRPPFVSRLAAEDRCHLNGLAMREGKPAYVTAVSESDAVDGWRDHRRSGGVVVDVASNEVVARGLSMPHSPRWYRDTLWLVESGSGHFGRVDLATGTFERIAFCPGYARGLSFVGDFALIGVSRNRKNRTFADLELSDNLERHKTEPRCGLQIIDLRSGDAVHWIRIEGVVEELFDVGCLHGVRRPMAIGFVTDEIRRSITIGE